MSLEIGIRRLASSAGCGVQQVFVTTTADHGWRASNLVCVSNDSHRIAGGWSLFLEYRFGNENVTYMGNLFLRSRTNIKIEITEYRGGSGAPDISVNLQKCREPSN